MGDLLIQKTVPAEECERFASALTGRECRCDPSMLFTISVRAHGVAQPRQGGPVALPARKGTHLRYDTLMPTFSKGWNACLDEIAKLGPLFTRTDPGEVERLRGQINEWAGKWEKAINAGAVMEGERNTLRAQLAELEALHGGELGLPKEGWPEYHKRKMETLRNLTAGYYERKLAERDALLRELHAAFENDQHPWIPGGNAQPAKSKLDAFLSASAEPSAPVDLDGSIPLLSDTALPQFIDSVLVQGRCDLCEMKIDPEEEK